MWSFQCWKKKLTQLNGQGQAGRGELDSEKDSEIQLETQIRWRWMDDLRQMLTSMPSRHAGDEDGTNPG